MDNRTIMHISAPHATSNNMQKMNTYRNNSISNQIPPTKYQPYEEVISVRELLRRLADGKVVLETKVKI